MTASSPSNSNVNNALVVASLNDSWRFLALVFKSSNIANDF